MHDIAINSVMLIWIVGFTAFTFHFAMFFTEQCIYRFINELATVRDHIFQTVHLPNVPRYDFGKIKKIFDNWA